MKKIFWIPFIFILIIGFILSFTRKQSLVGDNNSSIATTAVYENTTEGFSFSYPKEFNLADEETLSNQSWDFNSTSAGNLLVRVLIPKSIEPNTNFGEAVFDVGVSTSSIDIKNCLVPPIGNFVEVSTSTINGENYTVFNYSDAGAGNRYDIESLRAIHNNQCFVLESMIHSSNIGNYSPDQGIKEFDRNFVNSILNNIVSTFKFSN